jgi:hypothetical protein
MDSDAFPRGRVAHAPAAGDGPAGASALAPRKDVRGDRLFDTVHQDEKKRKNSSKSRARAGGDAKRTRSAGGDKDKKPRTERSAEPAGAKARADGVRRADELAFKVRRI